MFALACGTRINFQRGDSRAKLRRVWANPVRGGARDELIVDVAVSVEDPSLDISNSVVDTGYGYRCGHDCVKASMGTTVTKSRLPKKKSMLVLVKNNWLRIINVGFVSRSIIVPILYTWYCVRVGSFHMIMSTEQMPSCWIVVGKLWGCIILRFCYWLPVHGTGSIGRLMMVEEWIEWIESIESLDK